MVLPCGRDRALAVAGVVALRPGRASGALTHACDRVARVKPRAPHVYSFLPDLTSGNFPDRRPVVAYVPVMQSVSRRLRGLGLALAATLGTSACSGHPPPEPKPSAGAPQPLSAGASTPPAPQAPDPAPTLAAQSSAPGSPAGEPPAAKPAPEAGAPAPTGAGGLDRLTAEQRALLLAGPEDTLIKTPIHYVKSNEVRHDVYFPYVAGKGGAYIGVGSDQNYTVMAAAGSELAFLLDIDQSVVDLHRCYEALIEASPDPKTLYERWSAAQEEESVGLIAAMYAGLPEADRKRIVRLYRAARETVYIHLDHVIERTRDGKPTTWLSSPEMYAHVRRLYEADRIRMMGGDLTGGNSLQTAATAARALGVPVRVIYFSNAEEYFDYTAQFVANVEAQPGDEQTVVLRTIYSKKWVHADQLWAYQVQPWSDFRARLADRKNRSRNPMLRFAELDGALNKETGVKGFSLIDHPVIAAPVVAAAP